MLTPAPKDPKSAAVAIKITGLVQGVGFRKNTLDLAQRLALRGFVRNEPDGSVYLQAIGTRDALKKIIRWCRKGPSPARVRTCRVERLDPHKLTGQTTFKILY